MRLQPEIIHADGYICCGQFHKWHSELEAACASEMEEKYKRYADLLKSHLTSCEGILGQVGLPVGGGLAPCVGESDFLWEGWGKQSNSLKEQLLDVRNSVT